MIAPKSMFITAKLLVALDIQSYFESELEQGWQGFCLLFLCYGKNEYFNRAFAFFTFMVVRMNEFFMVVVEMDGIIRDKLH